MRRSINLTDHESQCEKQNEFTITQPRRKRIYKRKLEKKQIALQAQLPQTQQFPIQFIHLDNNNHNCPICLDLVVKSVTTVCGHSYCEYCLNEYLLFFEQCLQCGRHLRSHKYSKNRLLDEIIQAIVPSMNEERRIEYRARCEMNKAYIENKKVKSLNVGDIIDVRDKDYVWCQARIYKTTCTRQQQNRIKIVFINYIGKSKSNNEQIPQTSDRLATKGFYTSRSDVIQYQKHQNGQLKLKAPLHFKMQEKIVFVQDRDEQSNQ